jgi:hypothetical protein
LLVGERCPRPQIEQTPVEARKTHPKGEKLPGENDEFSYFRQSACKAMKCKNAIQRAVENAC